MGNMTSMSGSDGRRNDFYDYQDSDSAAATDYMEGEVSGFAYKIPGMEKHQVPVQQTHPQTVVSQGSIPLNPYVAINHGLEDFKHQNTEGRRTLHKGI